MRAAREITNRDNIYQRKTTKKLNVLYFFLSLSLYLYQIVRLQNVGLNHRIFIFTAVCLQQNL